MRLQRVQPVIDFLPSQTNPRGQGRRRGGCGQFKEQDTEVRFRSATDRAAFTTELTEAITKLVSKYRDESAPGGRTHRLVVVAHPLPKKPHSKEPS